MQRARVNQTGFGRRGFYRESFDQEGAGGRARRLASWSAGLVLLAGSAAAGPVPVLPLISVPGAPAQDQPLRFVQTSTAGTLRNIPDKKGLALQEVSAGTPLAVYGQNGPYLRVEVPGGYKTWIFGQYVRPTSSTGWLEVTGNPVNLRPLPESSNRSFPADRAQSGDRVRLIARQNPDLPLARDWVQVWAPAGATGWLAAADATALPAGADGAALFAAATAAALAATPAAAPASARAVPAAAKVEAPAGAQQNAMAAYLAAEALLEDLPEGATLEQIAVVQAAYGEVLELGPDAATRGLVDGRLGVLALRADLARMRLDMESREAESEARRSEIESQIAESNRKKDPLWGRFQVRGWLERKKDAGGEQVYVLRWGGENQALVDCTSGRYDLAIFEGYELGIQGFQAPTTAAGALASERIDAQRIEVISGRMGSGPKKYKEPQKR